MESFTPFPGEHIPLLLPCGHCFCSGCVAFFEKRDCPECRTKMGRKDLPRNFALLDMIASISTMATVQPGAGEKRKRMGEYSATELFALAEERKEQEAFVERKEVLVAALSQALDELVKANDRAALETRVTSLRDEMIRTIGDQPELASEPSCRSKSRRREKPCKCLSMLSRMLLMTLLLMLLLPLLPLPPPLLMRPLSLLTLLPQLLPLLLPLLLSLPLMTLPLPLLLLPPL